MNDFIHKPTSKDLRRGVFFSPVHTKALWNAVWKEARRQAWFTEDLGCVGNCDGYFYFQKRGLTTGYARIKIGVV